LYVSLNGGESGGEWWFKSVIENNLVVKTITTLCTVTITSIVIDVFDLMAVLFLTNSMLYLYTAYGSYTEKNMTTPIKSQIHEL
jgi:hypothetical protein